MKRIDRFDPVDGRPDGESERHYLEVHHVFARTMYRAADSRVRQYIANRALRQYDITGGFRQKPDAWRWVIEEVDRPLDTANSFIPEWARDIIWADHELCICNIDAYEVEENVVADRCSGQMSTVKYIFEIDQLGSDRDASGAHYEEVRLPQLREELTSAFGFRRMVANTIVRRAAVAPGQEPGQVIGEGYGDVGTRLRFEEYWFDNIGWGDEFFARPAVRALNFTAGLGRIAGYHVEERCGVDHR